MTKKPLPCTIGRVLGQAISSWDFVGPGFRESWSGARVSDSERPLRGLTPANRICSSWGWFVWLFSMVDCVTYDLIQ